MTRTGLRPSRLFSSLSPLCYKAEMCCSRGLPPSNSSLTNSSFAVGQSRACFSVKKKKSLEAPGLCLEWLGHPWDQEQNWKRTYRTSSLGVEGAVLNNRWLVPEKRRGNSRQMTDVHYRPRLHTSWLWPSHISFPWSCLPSIDLLIQKTRCNSTLVY